MIPQSIEAALVILLLPGRTWRFCARTVLIFVIPRTKQIESRILDFPLPLRPVIELKLSSLLADQHHSQCFAPGLPQCTILRSPSAQRMI